MSVTSHKVIALNSATHQGLQPLKIALINLMPQKEVTEEQFFRLLEKSGYFVEVSLIKMATYQSTTTKKEDLDTHYRTLDDIYHEHFDGLIITGAPIETIPFEEVSYWEELVQIMDWSQTNCRSTLHICWGAQAGLYHAHGVEKVLFKEKLSGVYPQKITKGHPLVEQFEENFSYPQSRHTGVNQTQLSLTKLETIAASSTLGPTILSSELLRNIYILGHLEYDTETLKKEYLRDQSRQLNPLVPKSYFVNDDPNGEIINTWGNHATLFYKNWLNQLRKESFNRDTSP